MAAAWSDRETTHMGERRETATASRPAHVEELVLVPALTHWQWIAQQRGCVWTGGWSSQNTWSAAMAAESLRHTEERITGPGAVQTGRDVRCQMTGRLLSQPYPPFFKTYFPIVGLQGFLKHKRSSLCQSSEDLVSFRTM